MEAFRRLWICVNFSSRQNNIVYTALLNDEVHPKLIQIETLSNRKTSFSELFGNIQSIKSSA